jgi:hypothetical protein
MKLSRLDHWAAAAKAFIWARFCFCQYQEAWRNSSASRWDPDAQEDIDGVDAAVAHLSAAPAISRDLPGWATDLLLGMIPASDPSEASPFLLKLAKIATDFRALSE